MGWLPWGGAGAKNSDYYYKNNNKKYGAVYSKIMSISIIQTPSFNNKSPLLQVMMLQHHICVCVCVCVRVCVCVCVSYIIYIYTSGGIYIYIYSIAIDLL